MSIDKNTVKHISKLARISLDENNVDSLAKDLTSIINASLKSRTDEVKDGKIRDQILQNSPEKNSEFFVVPKVIE